ncbi:MAG TPA: MFS transporter [Gaiellaceae bacterium]|jgi:FSR family fosmidomycin resistance protein-like MFS transporter|nr:MFS transporter [Gaiellaceae bacterium]
MANRRLSAAVAVLLAAEVLDELVFGAREAAWPLVRQDLGLSYAKLGLLLGLSTYGGTLLEPFVGILGDTRWRRLVVMAGGLGFALALLLFAVADSFWVMLAALLLLFVGAGAFVSLGQATLMDLEPDARERNMARWSVAGGVGAVAGPLAIAAVAGIQAGWRWAFAVFALVALVEVVFVAIRWPHAINPSEVRPSVRRALAAVRRPRVLRWLVVLELANLMTDVFLAFVALYFVDEVGTSAGAGGVAVAVWTGAGLVGGLGIVVLLRRVAGLRYLRASGLAALVLYPAFLLVPTAGAKLVLVAALGLATAGWYSIPKARLYASLPGQSGASITLGSLAGLIRGAAPLAIGLVAEQSGLGTAMWLLLVAPIGLVLLSPRA